MISPEIWESQNFSSLSDLAKIVFISLFSHADDEGRGRADPSFVKNTTFPYDGNSRRVADIKSALSEIARSMSVQLYTVNGIEYYFMEHWGRWQKINRPSKSSLPPPPDVGKGEGMHSDEKFNEGLMSNHGIFNEGSLPIIEQNRIEISLSNARTREEGKDNDCLNVYLKEFCNKFGIEVDGYSSELMDMDFKALIKAYEESPQWLQVKPNCKRLSWIVRNYKRIINGEFMEWKDKHNADNKSLPDYTGPKLSYDVDEGY